VPRLVAPFLKVSLGAVREENLPRSFEGGLGLLERAAGTIAVLAATPTHKNEAYGDERKIRFVHTPLLQLAEPPPERLAERKRPREYLRCRFEITRNLLLQPSQCQLATSDPLNGHHLDRPGLVRFVPSSEVASYFLALAPTSDQAKW
jgi:hypothetical protein